MVNDAEIDRRLAVARQQNEGPVTRAAASNESSNVQYYVDGNEKKKKSDRLTAGRVIGKTILAGLLVGSMGTGVWAYTIWDDLRPKNVSSAGITQGGHGSIKKIDMTIPPITLSTVDTEVKGVKAAYKDTASFAGLSIDWNQHSLSRQATAESLIRLDPKNVTISYSKPKDRLIYTLPSGTLTTKVGLVNTPEDHPKTSGQGGSFTGFFTDPLISTTDNLAGAFGGEGSSVPGLGDLAKGKLNIQNSLETFADLAITTSVDEKCTPLLKGIPNFTKQLDDNIKTVMDGPIRQRDDLVDLLQIPKDKNYEDTKKLIDKYIKNAEVDMPANYTIAPDPIAKKALEDFIKGGKLAIDKNIPSFTCGVSKSAKLSLQKQSRE